MAIYVGDKRYAPYIGDKRRRYMGGGASLPYDAEVEYLEATGTQYINTGVYPTSTYTFDTTVAVTASGNIVPWGCRSAGNYQSNNSQCYFNTNNNNFRLYTTDTRKSENWDSGITPTVNAAYKFVGMTTVSTMNNMTYPITLFALNNIGSINASLGKCRIFRWTAYNNGVIVADFIPVRKGSFGYMYDRVSGNLFANAGTGDFVLGNDIVEIDYLESSGTQVINTGIPVKDIGKYVTCCQFENASTAKAEGSTETSKYYFIGKNAQNKYYAALNSTVVTSTIPNDGAWHEFELDAIQGLFSIDGSIVNTLSAGYVNSNIKFALFACNGASAMEGYYSYHISGKKKWTKIYNLNGELILDLIPVRAGQVGYMRDKITGKLYGNNGTGSFTLGPDKT